MKNNHTKFAIRTLALSIAAPGYHDVPSLPLHPMGTTTMDPAPPRPIRAGTVNWLGVWTLYTKEVRRFLKIATQTILAPIISSLLFLAIFTLALGRAVETVGGVGFAEFLAPGLIMAAIIQNAFANTSSSLLISKIQGNIVDVLMPPLSPGELTVGFALAGVTRALMVALAAGAALSVFVPIRVHDPVFILLFAVAGALMLSLIGLLTGIWAEKFDQINGVTNFAVTPLAFLSGTFYSIERLPSLGQDIAHLNPFFYAIDGFRYGFIGHADGSLTLGIGVVVGLDVVLWVLCHRLLASGYKLKS